MIALQFPRVQQYLTGHLENYLEEKLQTRVSIGSIYIAFPKSVRIDEFYIEDRQQDTLVYSGRLQVDIGLFGLLKNKINVNRLELNDFYANVERIGQDTVFNYDFILEAFAAEDPNEIDLESTPDKDTTDGWEITVGTIELQNIRLNFNDELGGNHLKLALGRLQVEMDEVDLERNAYSVRHIDLENTSGSFRISKFIPDTTETESADLELALAEVGLRNIDFTYTNESAGQNLNLQLGEFLAKARSFSLLQQEIAFSEIRWNNSQVAYQQDPISMEDSLIMAQYAQANQEGSESQPWHVVADQIVFAENTISYDDNNQPIQESGMDFSHLLIENLTFDASDFTFSGMDIIAQINLLAFREKSGFELQELKTGLTFTDQEASLLNLYVRTGHSVLQNHFSLQYSSLESLGDQLGEAQFSLKLVDSYFGVQDILLLAPDMAEMPPIQGNEFMVLNAQATLNGKVNDFTIEQANLTTLTNTSLEARGRITGLPETENAFFNFTRFRMVSNARDLNKLIIPDTMADQYQLPDRLVLTATFRGSLENFTSQAFLNTNLGDIRADISMAPTERYTGEINVNELQLGTILRNDSLFGPVTLALDFQGQGLEMESMNTSINLLVQQAVLNQYSYEGLTVQGKIEEAVFDGRMNYEDESLQFEFTGLFSLDLDTPKYDMTLNIMAANLKKMNLTEDDIAFRGALVADISGNHINNINGDVGIRNVLIVKEGETYRIDSLLFASITGDRQTKINIDSDILTAKFEGSIYLTDLAPVMTRHLNQYYTFQETPTVDTLQEQNFEFEILLHNPELLTEVLVPSIETFVPGYITGSYNSNIDNLHIDILIPRLVYDGYTIDTLTFYVDSDRDFLNFGSSITRFALGSYEVTNLAVVGQVYDDLIETRLQKTDEEFMEQYAIGGIFTSLEEGYRFHLDPSNFILDYNEWELPESNYIELGTGPVFVNDVIISRGNERLSINSVIGDQADSVLNVEFANFKLETITQMVQSDTTIITGHINGFINIDQEAAQLSFLSDLNVNDIVLMGYGLGNLAIHAESGDNSRINVDVVLSGNENNATLVGYYLPLEETNEINLDFDLQRFNLASFTGPLQGVLTNPTGTISGTLQIRGSTETPDISGSLAFNETRFFVDYLQTRFDINNQRILFDQDGIRFNRFAINDARGNTGRINGYILTQNYTDYNFDLAINSNNFMVLNTSEGDNELFYGRVVVDLEMSVTGSMLLPNVVMELRVKEQTNLTYVLEDGAPATVEIDGLVEFITPQDGPEQILAEAVEESENDALVTELTGINLTADVLVEQGAALRIVIDPDAGDYLTARANQSSLSLNMDQVGNITLTGTFEIASGAYQLSFYDIVRRRFDIEPGSQITWTGDPLNAILNITAIHTVQTPPAGIMTADDPRFRRQLPVQALLIMQGNLLSPEISFGLDVDENETGAVANEVRLRLNALDEADVNRQVFALLVLQRFLAENPLEGPGGGGIEATARNSVSQILTNQLNKLTQQLGGFDLAFDVQSQQGLEGYETQLDVTLSRTLFDDRLNIRVGGNIELEGAEQSPQSQERSGLANYIGDIVIEYRLTPSGNILLQLFREQTSELFYTDLIETGIGIIYNRRFNRFRELINSREEESEHNEARK